MDDCGGGSISITKIERDWSALAAAKEEEREKRVQEGQGKGIGVGASRRKRIFWLLFLHRKTDRGGRGADRDRNNAAGGVNIRAGIPQLRDAGGWWCSLFFVFFPCSSVS
jgi:hypothetical protein